VEHGARTIAFPAISCGVYGYPLDEAARIAVGEVRAFLAHDERIETVYLVCFGADTRQAYQRALQQD
jgi:O-acetyl-ADP-ribose deacetylase (regulator of RNase III)